MDKLNELKQDLIEFEKLSNKMQEKHGRNFIAMITVGVAHKIGGDSILNLGVIHGGGADIAIMMAHLIETNPEIEHVLEIAIEHGIRNRAKRN